MKSEMVDENREMKKRPYIRKASGAALAAVLMAALLAIPVGTASAGPREEHMSRKFCEETFRGNKSELKKCVEAETKVKEKLKGRRTDPRAAAYCRGATGGSYALFEKCIDSLESSKKKMMEHLERKSHRKRSKPR